MSNLVISINQFLNIYDNASFEGQLIFFTNSKDQSYINFFSRDQTNIFPNSMYRFAYD